MQIFNRGTKPLTLCSNKSAVKTELLHAKDETVILSDRSIIDDDKKRTEMLQHILTENDSMDCQPHNLAIFSTHAQYLLPPEKKICLTLPENFAPAMTKEEEAEMCDDLNYLINTIASYICKNYELFRDRFKQNFIDIFNSEFEQYSPYFQGKSKEIITAGALLDTVYFCVIDCILDFDSQPIAPLIYSILYDSQTVSGTSEDAVSEHFIAALNDAIRSGKLKILQHSKGNGLPGRHKPADRQGQAADPGRVCDRECADSVYENCRQHLPHSEMPESVRISPCHQEKPLSAGGVFPPQKPAACSDRPEKRPDSGFRRGTHDRGKPLCRMVQHSTCTGAFYSPHGKPHRRCFLPGL